MCVRVCFGLRQVVLYNRGKTANKQIPGESDAEFAKRCEEVKTIVGDRKDPEVTLLSLVAIITERFLFPAPVRSRRPVVGAVSDYDDGKP